MPHDEVVERFTEFPVNYPKEMNVKQEVTVKARSQEDAYRQLAAEYAEVIWLTESPKGSGTWVAVVA